MDWPRASPDIRAEAERAMEPFLVPIAVAYALSRAIICERYASTGHADVALVQALGAFLLIGLAWRWWQRPPHRVLGAVTLSTGILYGCALYTELAIGPDPERSMLFLILGLVAAALVVDLKWLMALEGITVGSWAVTVALGYTPGHFNALVNAALILGASAVLLQLSSRRNLALGIQHREQRALLAAEVGARKELEDHLVATQKFQSLAPLAAGLAHDINNLMTTVGGYAEVVRDDPNHPDAQRSLEWIMQAAESASALADQLLTYSGQRRVARERVELASEVGRASRALASRIPSSIAFSYPLADQSAYVESNAEQLEEIVDKLVTNSLEAIGSAPGRVTVAVETTPAPILDEVALGDLEQGRDAYHSIVVEDTGTGIQVEPVAKIFDPFFTTRFQGRGLGLAAVLGIARAHQGAVLVRSSAAGTRFRIFLRSTDSSAP